MSELSILALDCSTHCGWAYARQAGTQHFPLPRGSSPGMRWVHFREWLREMIVSYAPQIVVFEQPLLAGRQSSTAAAEVAYGMITRVQELCCEHKIEYRAVNNATIKQFAVGAGNAKKEAVVAAASARWPDYCAAKDEGGNEADARWLLAFAQAGFPDMAAAREKAVQAAQEARQQARAAEKAADAEAYRFCVLADLKHYGTRSLSELVEWNQPLGRAAFSRALAELEAAGTIRKCGRRWELTP